MSKPKRALIIHPNNDYNCGDQITFLGTKALLTQALGGPQVLDVVQFDIVRAIREQDTYVSQFCWGEVDIIALAGSPWLWLGCERSDKYQLLTDAIKRYPSAKKVALGIGSCMEQEPYENATYGVDERFYNYPPRKKIINEIYSQFDCIYTRDAFAQHLLKRCNISSRYVYDTSAYAKFAKSPVFGQTDKKVLWFYDPSMGCSRGGLSFDVEEYITYQLDWAKKNDADIYCNSDGEKGTLMRRGIEGSFSVDLQFLYHRMAEYSEMLTGRIHMGVLGFISGVPKITVLPVDTRFLTVLKFGMEPKFIGNQWRYNTVEVADDIRKDIEKQRTIIVGELRDALN